MLRQRTGGLETLRQRATCPICHEFYTTPKRLGCSHVFCLGCLKSHLQVHRAVNFPPCPMCRRPINKAYRDLTSLDTARAEEEIVDYVRQFETCGLCNQKENPSVKCFDCEILLCDDCHKCHDMMKPNHIIVSITSCDEIYQHSNFNCSQHGKLMNKFCIMCERALCVLCEWFEHDACKHMWDEHDVQDKYRKGILSQFIHCISSSKWSKTQTGLPRVVNLYDLLMFGRHWQVNNITKIILRQIEDGGSRIVSANQADKLTPERFPTRYTRSDDVLRLKEMFELERRLDSAISFNYGVIRVLLDSIWLVSFNIISQLIAITGFPASMMTSLCVFSSVYFWIIARNWGVLFTNATVNTFREKIPSPNIHSKIRKAIECLTSQFLMTSFLALVLYSEDLTNDKSVKEVLITAVWIQFFAFCLASSRKYFVRILPKMRIKTEFRYPEAWRVRLHEFWLVQGVRSYLSRPKYAIPIIVALLSRSIFDLSVPIWGHVIDIFGFVLAYKLMKSFMDTYAS